MKSKIIFCLLTFFIIAGSVKSYSINNNKVDPKATTLLSNGTVQCNTEIPVPLIAGTFDNLTATSSTSGLCLLGCGISNTNRISDSNANNYATASTGIGLGVTHRLRVTDSNDIFASGTFAGFRIAPSGGLISVDLLNNISIRTYLAGVPRETSTGVSLLSLSLLSNPGNYILGFNTNLTFDAIEISINSLAGVATSTNIYYAVIRNYCAGPDLACNIPTALNLPAYPAAVENSHTGLSGISVGSILNPESAISSSATDHASLTLTAGVLGSVSFAIKDQVTDYPAGTFAGFDIENINLASVSALSNVQIVTYLNGTPKQQFSGTNLLANGTLLSSSGRYKLGFVANTPFDEVQINLNQTAGVTLGLTKVYSAVFQKFCAGPDLPCNTPTAISAQTYPVFINGARTGIDGLACVLCSIINTDRLIDNDPNNFALIDLTASVGTASKIAVKDQITDYPAGTFAGYDFESIALLNANVFDAIRVTTYLNGSQQETKSGNGALISVNTILLAGSSRQTIGFVTTLPFDEVQITLTNLATVTLGTVKVYSAVMQKFCPTTVECNKTYALTSPAFPVYIDGAKSGISGLACVACVVNDIGNVITASTSDYARITITAGVIETGSIAVKDQLFTYPPGTFAGFTIKDLNTILEADLFQSLTILTYNNGMLQETKSGGQLLSLSLLVPIFGSGPGFYNVGFKATLPFDEIRIRVGSLASVISNINVYGAFVNTKDSNDGGTGSLNCNTSDLSILKTASSATPAVGSNVTFTIVASNGGPRDADGVVVNDILPSGYTYVNSTASSGAYDAVTGAWEIGNLNTGSNATLTIIVTVRATGNYANTATITGNQPDPNLNNNTSTSTPTPVNVILANDDVSSPINGFTGGTFTNVLANDTLNGQPVNPAQVNTTFVSSTNPGITLSGTNVIVASGTPAGSYSLVYKICEITNPMNCDQATVFVTVNAPIIDAVNDTTQPINGYTGGTFTNVLANDTLNGQPVNPAQVNTTFVSSTNPGITLSGTNVIVASGTPAGSYSLVYKICEITNPTNCDQATVFVTVTAPIIDAVNDTTQPINGYTGGTFTNVLANDTLNGQPVNPAQVNTTFVSSTNPGITLSGTNVIVASGTPAGSYSLVYKICEITNPTNCDQATVFVTVTAPIIDAVNDTTQPINGYTGGTFTNVLANDTLNGQPVNPSQVNTTFVSSTNPGITLSGTNVIVAPGTPAGSYSLVYKICEITNPINCDQATVFVTVSCNQIAGPSISVTQPTCTLATGSITITSPTGSGFTYSIGGAYQSGTLFSGLTTGNYNVTFKDGNNCISLATVAVINSQPATPVTPTVTLTQPNCNLATGSITVTTPTGTGLTYSIGGAYQSNSTFSNVSSGNYTVTVKNSSGCISPGTAATINVQPTKPETPSVTTVQPTCTIATGSITITAPTGSGLTYSIGGVYQSSNTFTNVVSGNYSVTVKNNSGCISLATLTVINQQPSVPAAPTISLTQPTCSTTTGIITITTPTGTGFTYSLNNDTYQSSNIFSGIASGNYNVTVKNSNGCISPATLAVINGVPTSCNTAGIYHTAQTCTGYNNNSSSQLIGQLCYSTRQNKVSNVTPGQFFYSTSLTAPSASFCVDIVQTKNCNSLALFSVNQGNQITLFNAGCGNVASGVQISLGLGRVCITNAVPGAQYILFAKYDAKSIVNSTFTGTAPTCQYNFISQINGVTIPGSETSVDLVPNCSSKNEVDSYLTSTVSPNPSKDNFELQIKSSAEENVSIRIIDTNGRIIKEFISNPQEVIRFGNELTSGLYFVEITQGMERTVVKAQKL
ncbi:T9SS type A sorting domain-containing protein [Flavobacterium sp.]|uniref:T9SS type A sorting domain-containing protein n=1 Tax=Flavobacterium sp. TaxID=239 RepID=UPI00391CFE8E